MLLSLRGALDLEAFSSCWVKNNFIPPSFREADIKTLAIKPISNMACLAKVSWKITYYTTYTEVYSQFVNRTDKAKKNGTVLGNLEFKDYSQYFH